MIACGSKEFGSPPFPFPPPGASRGHRRLRCATARARRRPKAKRLAAFWAGEGRTIPIGLLRPPCPPRRGEARTLCCKPDISLANKTGHLDVLPTMRRAVYAGRGPGATVCRWPAGTRYSSSHSGVAEGGSRGWTERRALHARGSCGGSKLRWNDYRPVWKCCTRTGSNGRIDAATYDRKAEEIQQQQKRVRQQTQIDETEPRADE